MDCQCRFFLYHFVVLIAKFYNFLLSIMNDFSWISLFKLSRDVLLRALLIPSCEIMKSDSHLKSGFIVLVISSTVPPLRNCIFTLYLFVISRSSLISKIVESPAIATVPLAILHWLWSFVHRYCHCFRIYLEFLELINFFLHIILGEIFLYCLHVAYYYLQMSFSCGFLDVVFLLLSDVVVVFKITGSFWLKLFSLVSVFIFFVGKH